MNGKISKFEADWFCGDYGRDLFVVNRAKYTKEQAVDMYKKEGMWGREPTKIVEAAVQYRAGINEDLEPVVGWWLHFDCDGSEPRKCPVWVLS